MSGTIGLRTALRSIGRSKLFALTALVAFSFGIASTTTVFSVLDTVLLRPANFRQPDSIVEIQAAHAKEEWDHVSPAVVEVLRGRGDLFRDFAVARQAIFTVTRVAVPDQVFGVSVSGNFFGMVPGRPWLGRGLIPSDEQKGAARVVVLSYRAWRQMFGGDVHVVGKSALIDGEVHTVVGVMPERFALPEPNSRGLLWTTSADLYVPGARSLQVFARRKEGLSLARLQQALNGVQVKDADGEVRLHASELRAGAGETERRTLWLAMGMVAGLLLIGCANLSSILLARTIGRRRDFAIRVATGAGRWQLIWQELLEVGVLAVASFGIASVISAAAVGWMRSQLSSGGGARYFSHLEMDGRTLLFSFGVTLFCALACGLFPAVRATSIDVAAGLREAGVQVDGGRPAKRFLYSLLSLQAGVSVVLLLTSGLLVRSLWRLMSEDHGLKVDHVLTLRLPTGSWQAIPKKNTEQEWQRRIARYMQFMRQAQSLQGVEAAALASSLPLSNTVVSTHLYAPGKTLQILPVTQAVTRDYFRVMGIPVLSGHTFEAANGPVALVNQAFVREYFHGQDPVGQFLRSPDMKEAQQIIGVVKDSPHLDLNEPVAPEVFSNFEQTSLTPFLTGLVVRTQGNPEALAKGLRDVSTRDADQAVVQVKTLQRLVEDNTWQPRFSAWLFSAFAGLALCLSGIGIYGVVVYVTSAHRRDFGIRAALGAEPWNLLRLAALQSLIPVLVGCCFGVVGFYWTSKWIGSLLYKVSAFDPVNGVVCLGILFAVAAGAVAGPAVKAARVDPASTLR